MQHLVLLTVQDLVSFDFIILSFVPRYMFNHRFVFKLFLVHMYKYN